MADSKIIKGKYLVVNCGDYTAYATSHTLSISAETEETAYKGDGQGLWTKAEVSKKSWEATSENLYTTDAPNFLTIGTEVDVTMQYTPYTLNDEGTAETAGTAQTILSGKGIITSIQINANVGENATYSVTITGQGALTGATSGS